MLNYRSITYCRYIELTNVYRLLEKLLIQNQSTRFITALDIIQKTKKMALSHMAFACQAYATMTGLRLYFSCVYNFWHFSWHKLVFENFFHYTRNILNRKFLCKLTLNRERKMFVFWIVFICIALAQGWSSS